MFSEKETISYRSIKAPEQLRSRILSAAESRQPKSTKILFSPRFTIFNFSADSAPE